MDARVVQENPTVVCVSGEIDLSNKSELLTVLNGAAERAADGLVVDMSDVTYMDSAGVQALLSTYSRMADRGGMLVLIIKHPNIREVMRIIHADMLPGVMLCDSTASALQALSGCLQ